MRQTLIKDLNKRLPNNINLILEYLFADNGPEVFNPEKRYEIGDLVYEVDDTENFLTIWKCQCAGIYDFPEEPYWMRWNVQSEIKKPYDFMLEQSSIYNITSVSNRNVVPMGTVPDDLARFSHYEVYYNGLYIPSINYTIIDRVVCDPSSRKPKDPNGLTIVRYDPRSHLVCSIIKEDVVISVPAGTYEFTIGTPITGKSVGCVFDVYIDGLLVTPDLVKNPSTNKWYVEGYTSTNSLSGKQVVIAYTYSVSDRVAVSIDVHQVTSDQIHSSFMYSLRDHEMIHESYDMNVYKNGKLLDPETYGITRGIIHMNKVSYYWNSTDRICDTVKFYDFDDNYITGGLNEKRHNTIRMINKFNSSQAIPVPFWDFEEMNADMFVFAAEGTYVSPTKWYVTENNIMKWYDHIATLDYISEYDFKLLNMAAGIDMRRYTLVTTINNQNSYDISNIPYIIDDGTKAILFTASGEYISPTRYTMNASTLEFNTGDNPMSANDLADLYIFTGKRAEFAYDYYRVVATEDNQTVFKIPDATFDYRTNGLIMFSDRGYYVSEKFYSLNTAGDTVTLLGSGITKGSSLEFYIF